LIVAQAARHNRQSRGCHYRVDSVSEEGDRLIQRLALSEVETMKDEGIIKRLSNKTVFLFSQTFP
jgi:hypothetical protein